MRHGPKARREAFGLYRPEFEHDACGVGFVVDIHNRRGHDIIERGIEVLERLMHRGAVGGDPDTGDGAGILIQIPDAFFRRALDAVLPAEGGYGVGMFFLPRDGELEGQCLSIVRQLAVSEGFAVHAEREVPVDDGAIGRLARESRPSIRQIFFVPLEKPECAAALERKLYVLRRAIENAVNAFPALREELYIPSLSARTVVYKGLLMAPQLPEFYPDLGEDDFASSLAIVHQRYSTNTFPTWALAQPFRYLAHNGEINTLRGNINQMNAREHSFASPLFGDDIKKLLPIIQEGQSDSACLDNALELFYAAGRSLPHAIMMLIPQAWGEKYHLGRDLRGFFEYHAGLMEPWDGPAAVAFSDGLSVGAMLDRNGLRPARYTITKDGFMVLASEAGVLDIPAGRVANKGALRPGQMIFVDLKKERVLFDAEIQTLTARRQPYRRWVAENKIQIHGFFDSVTPPPPRGDLLREQIRFGYTREELGMILDPMAASGHEPTGSMGNDAALAVLSRQPQSLYAYFKQLFAQVTNPPIDPIRESLVMSLTTFIGNQRNTLTEKPQHAHLLKLKRPIITDEDLRRIRDSQLPSFKASTLRIGFKTGGGGAELRQALKKLGRDAESAVRSGNSVIILSDRHLGDGQTPIPALLAVAAVNRQLVDKGLRTDAGLVVRTGGAREVMHFALLLGFGATAVNPYLALSSIADRVRGGHIKTSVTLAIENYIKAIDKGLLKIMSKMGISTLRSYRGAQIFEVIGLDSGFVDEYFAGTASRIGGIGIDEIAREAEAMAVKADNAGDDDLLAVGGNYHFRHQGESHLWTPETITLFQRAVRGGDYGIYKEYAAIINHQERDLRTLRGMFRLKKAAVPIPVEQVESAAEIVKRFVSGAMSFGSISREAHETIAIAMNRLGGMSNSGEGGEDPVRFKKLSNGDNLCSAIKQVASGRFGVTIDYLASGREVQIKIAQGAKPGEGGQLPGHKVDGNIARVRHSTPGVTLISPPPHHDIYSIEDLSQLIYDLKNANPEARISVKLVSEIGVGTVAAGVAKGHADMVLVSGHDGGTGASPLTSIKHAGAPWELGLAETQQTLVANNLRGRIRVQVDGQLKTGRDVIVGALLGAEEFGFATTILVAVGCVMMRKCHSNTCPVGVATQDPELRKRYKGRPEHIENFLLFLAEEVRETLAEMGFEKLDDIIGRSDLLETNDAVDFWKSKNLDFSQIFAKPENDGAPTRFTHPQDHGIDKAYDRQLIEMADDAIASAAPFRAEMKVENLNRSVGTMLSWRVSKVRGENKLPDDTIVFDFAGCAGQSFGGFLAKGLTFNLIGESNDYVGKGLSGGKITVRPPADAGFDPAQNVIVGNVLLYGATSGEVYINGRAGERFAIRNSGATAVVEGVGDHCCEYMTGGRIVVLGTTGVNFAAGMSGGIAYVFDEKHRFDEYCNLDMVDLESVSEPEDIRELRGLIESHLRRTGSPKAKAILHDWENSLPDFVKVFPMEYRRVLGQMMKEDADLEREEQTN